MGIFSDVGKFFDDTVKAVGDGANAFGKWIGDAVSTDFGASYREGDPELEENIPYWFKEHPSYRILEVTSSGVGTEDYEGTVRFKDGIGNEWLVKQDRMRNEEWHKWDDNNKQWREADFEGPLGRISQAQEPPFEGYVPLPADHKFSDFRTPHTYIPPEDPEPFIPLRKVSYTKDNPDGSATRYHADGNTTRYYPDGTEEHFDASGKPVEARYPDGSYKNYNPDGSSTRYYPDGTEQYLDASGSLVGARHSDGSADTYNPDGSMTRYYPDGREAHFDASDNLEERQGIIPEELEGVPTDVKLSRTPDGSYVAKYPDGSVTNYSPDGTAEYYDASGNLVGARNPDGSVTGIEAKRQAEAEEVARRDHALDPYRADQQRAEELERYEQAQNPDLPKQRAEEWARYEEATNPDLAKQRAEELERYEQAQKGTQSPPPEEQQPPPPAVAEQQPAPAPHYDPATGVPQPDGDGDGIPNEYGDGPDLDGNGIPDETGINPDSLQPGYPDKDGDGVPDGNSNEIPHEYGDGPDLDANGVPDEIGINPDNQQPGYLGPGNGGGVASDKGNAAGDSWIGLTGGGWRSGG